MCVKNAGYNFQQKNVDPFIIFVLIVMIRDKSSNLATKGESTVRAAKGWRGQVGHAPRHHHYDFEEEEDRV